MAEDSGTAAQDPRRPVLADHIDSILDDEWPNDAADNLAADWLDNLDAADRAAGVIRVRVDDAKRQAIELAMVEALADVHARYPDGIKSSHIAVFLTAAALRVLTEP